MSDTPAAPMPTTTRAGTGAGSIAWIAAIACTVAYAAIALMMTGLHGRIAGAAGEDAVAGIFMAAHFLGCLFALIGIWTGARAFTPAIVRLPHGRIAEWALGLGALFGPLAFIFTGNTLDNLIGAAARESRAMAAITDAGLWLLLGSAIVGLVLAIVALVRKDRAYVLGLPIVSALLGILFVLGELAGG